jgi:hypothetical protein
MKLDYFGRCQWKSEIFNYKSKGGSFYKWKLPARLLVSQKCCWCFILSDTHFLSFGCCWLFIPISGDEVSTAVSGLKQSTSSGFYGTPSTVIKCISRIATLLLNRIFNIKLSSGTFHFCGNRLLLLSQFFKGSATVISSFIYFIICPKKPWIICGYVYYNLKHNLIFLIMVSVTTLPLGPNWLPVLARLRNLWAVKVKLVRVFWLTWCGCYCLSLIAAMQV